VKYTSILLPEADLKSLYYAYLISLLLFEIPSAAVHLVRMRGVLTLELLGIGVWASELAVALVSGLPCPFCAGKIHAEVKKKKKQTQNATFICKILRIVLYC